MRYKTIVVHLDTGRHTHARLDIALHLAKRFEAYLIGVYAVFNPDPRAFYVMAGTASYYIEQEPLRVERRRALERLFRAELTRAEVAGEWLVAGEALDEAPGIVLTHLGRCADLIVAGQDDPDDPESFVGEHFPETLALSAGCPVLLVPHTNSVTTTGTHVMIGWDGSREAARAVHDAMPFMRTARTVAVVTADGTLHERRPDVPGADIATRLARHDVKAEVAHIEIGADESAGDALLAEAARRHADLLVMGAYGHARWEERLLGGATRTALQSMILPVLMSH